MEVVDKLFAAAREAACYGALETRSFRALVQLGDDPSDRALVSRRATAGLTEQVMLVLHRGWEPREVSFLLRRNLSAAAANFGEGVLGEAVQRRSPDEYRAPRWERQVSELAPTAASLHPSSPTWQRDLGLVVLAAAYLANVRSVPDLVIGSRQCPAHPDVDPGTLQKVRALLAKAEATSFEEEADAFLSKAQELMTRHNLSRAALEDAAEQRPGVETRRCWLDDPYLKQKALLLSVVANANRCQAVATYEIGFSTLFGHPDDLSATEMLFTSLLVHATKQMTLPSRLQARLAAPDVEKLLGKPGLTLDQLTEMAEVFGRSNHSSASYRRSFLIAYANRIGRRLSEVATAATQAAVESVGASLLPVLASRERHVEEAVAKMFPRTTTTDFRITDRAGWAAGVAAADMADLSPQPKLASRA